MKLLMITILFTFMGLIQNNPLTSEFKTPHQTAPFSEIKNEHFIPAFEESIKQGEAEIKAIIENPQAPTFENTIAALDNSGKLLSRTAGVFFNLLSAETSDELQQIAQQVSPILTKFQNDITLNPELFKKVKTVYDKKETLGLTAEQKTLLENTYQNFVRRGANLSDADKEKFREISAELSITSLKFDENVLKETNSYEKHITDKNLLKGLPESALEAAAGLAKSKGKEGWIFDITAPSYQPFMKYADNRELRKELYLAYNSKSFKGNEFDNQEIVKKIVKLRLEIAQLMGYKNYADYVLEQRMATNQAGVYKLLDDLYEASYKVALKEKSEVQEFAFMEGFRNRLCLGTGHITAKN
jgi:peptidyl-dipeptidase Dcp